MNDHTYVLGVEPEQAIARLLCALAILLGLWTVPLAVALSTVHVTAHAIEPNDLATATLPNQPLRRLTLRRAQPGTCRPRPRPAAGMG